MENKEASRRYLGGTEMREGGWSRGDNQPDLMERKKGYLHPSVFEKFHKSGF